MKYLGTIIGSALLLGVGLESPAQVVINEIMQSNIDCVMDDLNEFPDSWVELYNAGSTTVPLTGYKLGLTDNADSAWALPVNTIAAGGYLLVYCDKEATGLHTDFRLDSGKGGAVYLFRNNEVVDKLTNLKKQPAPNIAYGRQTDGADAWGYQAIPTPGAGNCGTLCTGVLGNPVFSEPGRVVTDGRPLSLTISVPEGAPAGTVVRYTTNGTEPTATSFVCTGPISITGNRVVRAKLFCDGWLSPRSTTHSYLFFPRQLTLPVVSIVTNQKYFDDTTIGIYVDGSYSSTKKNYEYNWRRPVNLEFFEGQGQASVLNQLCETRVQGGASRGSQLKSLIVYANKRFGAKRLAYEFFPDQRLGLTDYKSIILRNAGNDFDYLYMRDAIIQRTMAAHADLDWQAWRPAIVYINGTYKGMLNIRERSTADNIYTNYGGLEDIDMIENWHELKEGDKEHYNRFQAFYNAHGHTMAEYEEWMDCKEFINLMAMNLYYNNQDFPANNIVMWRPRTENGRWRFVAKDTDFGLGLYGTPASYNTIAWLYWNDYDSNRNWGNTYEATRLFRRLMEDADFHREFIDHCAVYMGDFMNERGTRAVWDPMYEQIKTEYPNHRKLINQWWPNYASELSTARAWVAQRTANFYQQLADYYGLGTPTPMTVNQSMADADAEAVEIRFNGIPLSEGRFEGKFFQGRNVTLTGLPVGDWQVAGWTVRQVAADGTVTTREVAGSQYAFAMPACGSLEINATLSTGSGVERVHAAAWSWRREANGLLLSHVPAGTRVFLYDMRGVLLAKSVSDGLPVRLPAVAGHFYLLRVGDETVKIR